MFALLQLAKLGQKVGVRYRGTLAKSGKVFDETKGNKTFSFRLGERYISATSLFTFSSIM